MKLLFSVYLLCIVYFLYEILYIGSSNNGYALTWCQLSKTCAMYLHAFYKSSLSLKIAWFTFMDSKLYWVHSFVSKYKKNRINWDIDDQYPKYVFASKVVEFSAQVFDCMRILMRLEKKEKNWNKGHIFESQGSTMEYYLPHGW